MMHELWAMVVYAAAVIATNSSQPAYVQQYVNLSRTDAESMLDCVLSTNVSYVAFFEGESVWFSPSEDRLLELNGTDLGLFNCMRAYGSSVAMGLQDSEDGRQNATYYSTNELSFELMANGGVLGIEIINSAHEAVADHHRRRPTEPGPWDGFLSPAESPQDAALAANTSSSDDTGWTKVTRRPKQNKSVVASARSASASDRVVVTREQTDHLYSASEGNSTLTTGQFAWMGVIRLPCDGKEGREPSPLAT